MSVVRISSTAALAALLLWAVPLPAQARRASPPPIPAIPDSSGPLSLRVIYPLMDQRITATDSTFMFGSTGNGSAELTINGLPISVAPNGAFLAWVPVPADSAPVFRFVARLGTDSIGTELRVSVARRPVRPEGPWLDPASIMPRGVLWADPDELIRFAVVAAPNAAVQLEVPGQPPATMVPDTVRPPAYGPFDRAITRVPPREVRYVAAIPARLLTSRWLGARSDSAFAPMSLTVQRDTTVLRAIVSAEVTLIDPARRPVVLLHDDTARTMNTDGAVAATPEPSGTYHWFLANGTPAAVSGRIGSQLRLALSPRSSAWIEAVSVAATMMPGTPPPRARLAQVRLSPSGPHVSARLSLSARVPFRVDEEGSRIMVRLYSTTADADWLQYGEADSYVQRMTWQQDGDDEVVVTFELPQPVYGWRVLWRGTDLYLDIRKPPRINAARPLAGRLIAIDPGHPPAGATGPTGLTEAEANLAVARRLRDLLVRAGARVIMTRDDAAPLGLYERTNYATDLGAELLVSIHNNAFPDGVNPWLNNGTSTYYYMPRSARLARLVQQGMVRTMGLRDLGFGRGDLALVRVTWMPSVLTEGAFMMIPQQEHGLRTPAFQRAYARGVMDGLAAYFRELGR